MALTCAGGAFFLWRGALRGERDGGEGTTLKLARDCSLLSIRARAAKDPAELAAWFVSKNIRKIAADSECRKDPDWTPLSSELYMHFLRIYTLALPSGKDGKRAYLVFTSPRPRRDIELDEPPCLVELIYPADKLASSGDVKGALKVYRALEMKIPGLPALAERIGKCHARLGDFPKAENYLEKAIMLAGPLPGLYQSLGEIYEKSDRTADAVSAFEKAAGLDPGKAAGWILLARACRKLGDREKTTDALKHALEADSNNKEALELLGAER